MTPGPHGLAGQHGSLDDFVPDGEGCGGGARRDAQLIEDAGDVAHHRARADEELRGDLPIRFALHEVAQHIELAGREMVCGA